MPPRRARAEKAEMRKAEKAEKAEMRKAEKAEKAEMQKAKRRVAAKAKLAAARARQAAQFPSKISTTNIPSNTSDNTKVFQSTHPSPSSTSRSPVKAPDSPSTPLASTPNPSYRPIEAISHGPVPLAGLPTFQSKAEKRQWQLEHLAGAFRIFARHGYTEGLSGHISVRDPIDEDAFWINPLGVHFGILKASDMLLVHLRTGEILRVNDRGGGTTRRPPPPINATGFHIHAAIHRARPDVHAICHAHGIHGRAWSAFARPLDMLNQNVCILFRAHSVYARYGGLALDGEEGKRIADALGDGKGCILMNHGLLTVGSTVDEAAYLFRLMEKSCEVQLLVEAAAAAAHGKLEKKIISDEEAAYNYSMASEAESLYCEFQPEYEYELFLSGGDFRN